ncbi:hypothetical protein BDW22DRAFT_1350751 [Trametopsis cervina]|nr:hypothetical protein BDW22DRAFT_1350751 [Trametopsis cervina]
MPPPPVQLFLTTVAAQVTVRQRQDYLLRILQVKKIPFTSYDLASDEAAKSLWRRKAPRDKQQLPGILVGGEFPGTFDQFEEAVEFNELDIFLRRKEDYKPFEDEKELLHAEPVGVPGAYSPLQMNPNHAPSRSPSPSPLALREKEKKEIKAGDTLAEFGLQDVSVSLDDLQALVEELGLGGDEASDLVKGLAGTDDAPKQAKAPAPLAKKKTAAKVAEVKAVEKDSPAKVKPVEEKEKVVEQKAAPTPSEGKEDEVKSSIAVTEEKADEVVDPSIVKITPPEESEPAVVGEKVDEAADPSIVKITPPEESEPAQAST